MTTQTINPPTETGAKQKTIKDALLLAARNAEFSEHLLKNPEQLKGEFNLTDAQVAQIKSMSKLVPVASGDKPAFLDNYESSGS